MRLVLSITICVLLFLYINYILEDFTTTSVSATTSTQNPSIKYFELNNEAKNLVNAYKYETQIREIEREEKEMRNNVRKIVGHAENVLNFTELNKDYLDNILVKHSDTDSDWNKTFWLFFINNKNIFYIIYNDNYIFVCSNIYFTIINS